MYGSATAKRHVAWSNSRTVQLLDLGRMLKSKYQHKGVKSSRTYINGQGRKRFSGSKHLKSTGFLEFI